MIAAAREAFAPVLKAQQEGFKTLERLARLQYGRRRRRARERPGARERLRSAPTNATELVNKHAELTTQLVDKLRTRAEEFATVTSEIQSRFTELGKRNRREGSACAQSGPDILAVSHTRGQTLPGVSLEETALTVHSKKKARTRTRRAAPKAAAPKAAQPPRVQPEPPAAAAAPKAALKAQIERHLRAQARRPHRRARSG